MKNIPATTICATLTVNRSEIDFIKKMYDNGMRMVRLNCAYLSVKDAAKILENIRKVSDKISVLIDTKGPDIRTTDVKSTFSVEEGRIIKIKADLKKTTSKDCIYVNYPHFVNEISIPVNLFIDDGSVGLEAFEKKDNFLLCKVLNNGEIGSRKGINVPGITFNIHAVSEIDEKFIHFAADLAVDFIAHSFTRSAEDVMVVKNILNETNNAVKIFAKIENQAGINNINEIADAADGILIARGDLGVEIVAAKIPGLQKDIIQMCQEKNKPVIVVTHLLQSMIQNPYPTRAEVSDVANAVFDGAEILMLTGETAQGKYPVEAINTLGDIIREAESYRNNKNIK